MPVARNPLDRFNAKIQIDEQSGCWIWKGSRDKKGYGLFVLGVSDRVGAHRWAWEQINGSIPEGMVLDHFVCSNPSCVNPRHLRPVTQRENILRGESPSPHYASRSSCPKCGGVFTQLANRRVCIPCKRKANREWARNKRNTNRSEGQCQ